jgi:MerR family transcriptional regulator/heat shock protein HspR
MTMDRDEPVYAIGVVERMVGLHAQTLRNYERWGLIKPYRSGGRVRLYSQSDLERIKKIKEWIDVFGLNVAGVEVMVRLQSRIHELETQVQRLTIEVVTLKSGPRQLPGSVAGQSASADAPGSPHARRVRVKVRG